MLESDGVAIWKMAVTLPKGGVVKAETEGDRLQNRHVDSCKSENSESDEDSDLPATVMQSVLGFPRVAIGYDDGRVGIYAISDADEFMHVKSLLRVKGQKTYFFILYIFVCFELPSLLGAIFLCCNLYLIYT